MNASTILIADDDRAIRTVLSQALGRMGHEVRTTGNASTLWRWVSDGEGDLVITDVVMPDENGLDLIPRIKKVRPELRVIVMSAQNTLLTAVKAAERGAFEYLPKPFDVERAVELIRRAVDESLREAHPEEAPTEVPEILGQAPAMQEVFRAIGRLSQSTVTVLITGESGSGKEVVARALHKHSARTERPFIALNMAAIPRDLLESELFGHERGAFTGAQAMRRGRFEQAEGGTLFLDEIGDMPAELQTRLLRVLSDGFYYRVGGHQPIKADVRVIAATHQNLDERVRQGSFREDLYHRLNVIRLRLPPLRERREDIAPLARHFLARSARELGVEPKRLSPEAIRFISQLPFPGNVRQLENLCHWLTVLAPAQVVKIEDLPLEVRSDTTAAQPGVAAAGGAIAPGPALSSTSSLPAAASAAPVPVNAGVIAAANASGAPGTSADDPSVAPDWLALLVDEVERRLESGQRELMDALARDFEAAVIGTALRFTHGRRIEAASKLGVGRNTITRKIQDLGLED
jgi:two-component system nitrogen regulation response regulator GlnG